MRTTRGRLFTPTTVFDQQPEAFWAGSRSSRRSSAGSAVDDYVNSGRVDRRRSSDLPGRAAPRFRRPAPGPDAL